MLFCELCSYSTNSRSKINIHHIVPLELNGSNNNFNLVHLCPTCHNLVYIPNAKFGQHSIKNEKSIIILGKKLSSAGVILNYINEHNIEEFSIIKNQTGVIC